MKDIVKDGLQQTTYSKDDMEKKIVIKEQVNINPHLQHNKALYNHNDGYSKSRELKRVASIPTIALSVWQMNTMVIVIGFDYQKKFKKKY